MSACAHTVRMASRAASAVRHSGSRRLGSTDTHTPASFAACIARSVALRLGSAVSDSVPQ